MITNDTIYLFTDKSDENIQLKLVYLYFSVVERKKKTDGLWLRSKKKEFNFNRI